MRTNENLLHTCAVSVIIPMYNDEKYIGALLESLLAQTFKNFEVVVVNDGSTDSSCKIVESCIPKFNGRLILSHMKKNSGGPCAPTNKGIARACGKYIYAVDHDDFLMPNALEVLYNSAEKYNSDVIYLDNAFIFKDDPQNPVPALESFDFNSKVIVEPSFDPESCVERIKLFLKNRTSVVGWRKFVRRDFLVENDITFKEDIKASQDLIWTIELIFHAKRYLRISEPVYAWRRGHDSITGIKRSPADSVAYWGDLLVKSFEALAKFFSSQKFFQENPQYGWMLLDWVERRYAQRFNGIFSSLPAYKIQKILEDLFVAEFGNHGELISAFCTSMYTSRYREKNYLEKIKKLEERIAKLENKRNIKAASPKLNQPKN